MEYSISNAQLRKQVQRTIILLYCIIVSNQFSALINQTFFVTNKWDSILILSNTLYIME